MTAKKVKEVKEKIQLTLENVKAGMVIKDLQGLEIQLLNNPIIYLYI